MIAPFVDPRVRMRAALHALVQADPDQWHEPSLQIFRNRLLDITGSDARPLADLLLEAVQRGWREALPRERIEPARWEAMTAPFVMRWSAERFVQPDMAQWAAESWGFAFGVIAPEQLRIVPPAPPRSIESGGQTGGANANGAPGNGASGNGLSGNGSSGGGTKVRVGRGVITTRGSMGGRGANTVASSTGATPRARMNARGRYTPTGGTSLPMLNPRLVWGLAAAAALSYVGFIGWMGWTIRKNKLAERAVNAPSVASSAATANSESPNGASALPTPAVASSVGAGAPGNFDDRRQMSAGDTLSSGQRGVYATTDALTPNASAVPEPTPTYAPQGGRPSVRAPLAMPKEYRTVTSTINANGASTDSTAAAASASARGRNPGVPSLTRSLLAPEIADRSRMQFVEPAQRASGNSRPVVVPMAPTSLAYDQVVLNDGTDMRGRVEVVRAGSVVFRDMRTGLRHELRKEDIDRIITEYGSPVRFRAEGRAPSAVSRAESKVRTESGMRASGVAGSYVVRYAAAKAVGSPECTDVWTRPPNATDRAIVRHIPGADTLTVFFDGGDNFPSNIDPEGFFASTFRIVPDQARTSTALTTRLTGQFQDNGTLALQVSIVFFRRMRTGRDLTCTVDIKATGSREGPLPAR